MQAHLPRALRAFRLNVRKRREAKGLTQERAGEKADLDPTYLNGIERDVRNASLLSVGPTRESAGRLPGSIL